MPGLIEDTHGLYFGQGLTFEPGLGSDGLTISTSSDTMLFTGAGSLLASTRQLLVARPSFAGRGSLAVNATKA